MLPPGKARAGPSPSALACMLAPSMLDGDRPVRSQPDRRPAYSGDCATGSRLRFRSGARRARRHDRSTLREPRLAAAQEFRPDARSSGRWVRDDTARSTTPSWPLSSPTVRRRRVDRDATAGKSFRLTRSIDCCVMELQRTSSSGFRDFAISPSSLATRHFSAGTCACAGRDRPIARGPVRRPGVDATGRRTAAGRCQLLEAETGSPDVVRPLRRQSRGCVRFPGRCRRHDRRPSGKPDQRGGATARSDKHGTVLGAYGLVLRGQELMLRYPSRSQLACAAICSRRRPSWTPSTVAFMLGLSRTSTSRGAIAGRRSRAVSQNERRTCPEGGRARDELDARGFAELGFASSTKSGITKLLACL